MPKPFLPESTKQTIINGIDVLYEKLKLRLLGSFYAPQIRIDPVNYDKTLTLPGLYTAAYLNADPLHRPALSSVQSLASVAESYINASAEKTKAQALFSVDNALKDASVDEDFDYEKELNSSLLNVFDQAHGEVKKVVETELQRAKTVGLQDGILDVMQSQGFDDPTVAFMTKKDAFVCKYCKEFFLQKDGITPRVYKLSELGSGYLNRKSPQPVMPPVHPNCFLYGTGRVYTSKGFKKIKNVSFGDKVYTHQKRFRGVENTLNFLKVPYQGPYYEIKSHAGSRDNVCVTPDHKVFTANGMKPISQVNQYNEKLVKMVKNCVVCYKPMLFNHPKYFCSNDCRNKAFGNLGLYLEKIDSQKFELEEFSAEHLITHHHKTKPTFLYDITVKMDHSLVYNGLVTNNCRCLMIGIYPGFGFNSSGVLEYKSEGYDEYKHQNALGKSLMDVKQILEHNCNEHRDNELLAYFK